jgi:Putative Ig domain
MSYAPKSTLTFITESLPAFVVGESPEVTLEVSGGTPPYTFEITDGDLPDDLALSDDGIISGTVIENEGGTVFIKVTDDDGASLTQAFDVQVSEP